MLFEKIKRMIANNILVICAFLSYPTLMKFRANIKEDIFSSSVLSKSMKEAEDHFRHLFATERNSVEISDPHLLLTDVYKNFGKKILEVSSPII